jgi:HD-GYP domain-containing protein (c-di-GMP phosphodiesterase class II)
VQPVEVRAPQAVGYSALVLERLLAHACVAHGVADGCLLVRDPARAGLMVVAAGHGGGSALDGTRVEVDDALAAGAATLPDGARMALLVDGAHEGLLAFGRRLGGTAPDEELLAETARLFAIALEQRRRSDQGALAAAVRAADAVTDGHCDRVAALAVDIGRELRLSAVERYELELTARLHDVGKLRVPTAVLDKPGPLDVGERELIRRHPAWGAEIVARIPGLEPVALLVRLHHERIDGAGYPHGLTGTRIPAACRIVAACDALSAIVDDRPYRAGRSTAEALRELQRVAGTQFDPAVVDALDRTLAAVH